MKLIVLLSVLSVYSVGTVLPAAEVRQALVMGVWDYSDPKFPALPGIEADVSKMTAKLKELGFTVAVVTNPTLSQAKDAVDDFGAKLKAGGGVGLFYFSGHGSEHDGKNYLVPKGTRVSTSGDLDDEALSAQRILTRMVEAENKVNLVFLDCCRNALSKKGGDDLAPMKATGTFIGFATASSNAAGAGDEGSPYTTALLENLGLPDVSITDVHTKVTKRVKALTGGDQTPFQYSGLDDVFYMVPEGTKAPLVMEQPAKQAIPSGRAEPSTQTQQPMILQAVADYYFFVNNRRVNDAYLVCSASFQARIPFEKYRANFASTKRVELLKTGVTRFDESTASVYVELAETDESNTIHYWSGQIELSSARGFWRINTFNLNRLHQ